MADNRVFLSHFLCSVYKRIHDNNIFFLKQITNNIKMHCFSEKKLLHLFYNKGENDWMTCECIKGQVMEFQYFCPSPSTIFFPK